MKVRTYGSPPYSVVVVHGGPGAPGEVAPVARELAKDLGVVEPLQTATTVFAQVEELKHQIEEYGSAPAIVIGYSWGAWLSYLLAAMHPTLVKKLILVSSGPFEAKYVSEMNERRQSRLSPAEKEEIDRLMKDFSHLDDQSLSRLGHLTNKTDLFDPVDYKSEVLSFDSDSFKGVWPEAAALRASGELLKFGKDIRCSVSAIHGEFDPHPAKGVEMPLRACLGTFRFIELEKCGHTPWIERHARERFFEVLRQEIQNCV